LIRSIEGLTDDWRKLGTRIDAVAVEIEPVAKQDEDCRRLASSPSVGPIIAKAMVAATGNGVADVGAPALRWPRARGRIARRMAAMTRRTWPLIQTRNLLGWLWPR